MIPPRLKNRDGFALVLVLTFVLLILAVVLAFFSNSILQRQISTSSADQGKVDLFAQGALDTTIGDLKQEIVAGSTTNSTSPPLASAACPIPAGVYWPNTPANMVPQRVGTADNIPNLVKTSQALPFYQGTAYSVNGPSRASSLNTQTSSSYPISPVRWNVPLLLPMPSGHNNSDLTPISGATGFTPPCWIYVDRSGNNPTAASADTIGRYAYCIYDEGGLLDMNVAGYPVEMTTAQSAHKIGSSFADLTQTGLTTAQIDTLLAWRNYASAQPSGSFPSYQFNATSALNYFNMVFSNPWGFMNAGNQALYNGQSDQKFASRQQLINFLTQAPISAIPDVVQYMGTFSRDLDQPSFRPDPNRPRVEANAGSYRGTGNFTTDAGGNDAYGLDDQINPFFLNVPVTASFTRNDGSTAIVGEPLVKKRFGINRLCWLTYKGPIASLSSSDPIVTGYLAQGFSQQSINEGDGPHILAYFGLTWNGSYWVYNHGITGNNIGRLSNLQGLREPDFFELLKAALTVGSLGKTAASSHVTSPNTSDSDQYIIDSTTGYQAIQIGANMIDQFDADSYPTHIQYTTTRTVDIYGSESLPYLYRTRPIGINLNSNSPPDGAMLALPEVWNPYDPGSPQGNPAPTQFRIFAAGPATQVYGVTRSYDQTGVESTVYEPINAINIGQAITQDTAPDPTLGSFSFSPTGQTELDFTIPSGSTAANQPIFIGGLKGTAQANSISMGVGPSNNVTTLASNFGATVDSNGYITDATSAAPPRAANPPLSYCGVLVGTFKTQWPETVTAGSPPQSTTLTYPLAYLAANAPPAPFSNYWSIQNPSTADECASVGLSPIDYFLQYKDWNGNWVTYADNHGRFPAIAQSIVKKGTSTSATVPSTATRYISISQGQESGDWATWMDPRTSRFGSFDNNYVRATGGTISFAPGASEPTPYYGISDRPDSTFGSGCWQCTPATGLASSTYSSSAAGAGPSIGWYPGAWGPDGSHPLFVPGFYADNAAVLRVAPSGGGNVSGANYFADPDGVVRRGMGGQAAGITSTNLVGLPLATPTTATSAPSRPYILNRPFRSVAEIGYVFSGTPWRNLDFSTPESGSAALLDVFCLNETPDPGVLVAGKVNLNTRQAVVLQALLSGSAAGGAGAAYKDETNSGTAGGTSELSSMEISQIATTLVARTTSTTAGQGPLENVAELVGKWNSASSASGASGSYNIDGGKSYVGFSSDTVNNSNSLDQVFSSTDVSAASTWYIQRMRESAVRALSAGGQTRVWNLMIDLVAQTGRYPAGGTSLDNFLVDGERRYWLHVAIDRLTGKVLDEQLEQVNE